MDLSSNDYDAGDIVQNPDVALDPTGDYEDWVCVPSVYDVDRSDKKIIIKGATYKKSDPKSQDTRVENVIVARSVDPERDSATGVTLSRYNLTTYFSKVTSVIINIGPSLRTLIPSSSRPV